MAINQGIFRYLLIRYIDPTISFLGPLPLPIIGNIYQIVKGDPIIFRSFHKLQQKYGPIVKFWLGSKQAALISGTEELKVKALAPGKNK